MKRCLFIALIIAIFGCTNNRSSDSIEWPSKEAEAELRIEQKFLTDNHYQGKIVSIDENLAIVAGRVTAEQKVVRIPEGCNPKIGEMWDLSAVISRSNAWIRLSSL